MSDTTMSTKEKPDDVRIRRPCEVLLELQRLWWQRCHPQAPREVRLATSAAAMALGMRPYRETCITARFELPSLRLWLGRNPQAPRETRIIARAVVLAFGWLLGDDSQPSVRFATHLDRILERKGFRHCRLCGCTEDYPCAGGCSWSTDPDICTQCAHTPDEFVHPKTLRSAGTAR